ncbi:MAG: hypothetical protein ABIY55_16685 [Kofleriaceae bacterium]
MNDLRPAIARGHDDVVHRHVFAELDRSLDGRYTFSVLWSGHGVVLVVATLACATPPRPRVDARAPLVGQIETDEDRRSRLVRELRGDILASFIDGDYLAFASRPVNPDVIDLNVGSARIGVGPDDVVFKALITPHSWNRWPLALASKGKRPVVRSKRLRVHLASDKVVEAAWMSDDVSWRIDVCGKVATIPLRVTALFAYEAGQWYEVFEHVSYARAPVVYPELRGARILDAFASQQLAEYPTGDLGAPLAAVLSGDPARMRDAVAVEPRGEADHDSLVSAPTFLWGPSFSRGWDGSRGLTRVDLGVTSFQPEDRRVGLLGTHGTIAYWIGNFLVEPRPAVGSGAGGKLRVRGTFIFEKRCTTPAAGCEPDRWIVVQGHISEPVSDEELASRAFGSRLQSWAPLRFDCRR